jgi:hypothetical protein
MSEWQRTVKLGRRDHSEPGVIAAFIAGGAAVVKHSGKDEPDLFVGFLDAWRPVETKTDNGKLSEGQIRWWREVAKMPPVVARTPAQARKWLAVWRERPTEGGGGPDQAIEDAESAEVERTRRVKGDQPS